MDKFASLPELTDDIVNYEYFKNLPELTDDMLEEMMFQDNNDKNIISEPEHKTSGATRQWSTNSEKAQSRQYSKSANPILVPAEPSFYRDKARPILQKIGLVESNKQKRAKDAISLSNDDNIKEPIPELTDDIINENNEKISNIPMPSLTAQYMFNTYGINTDFILKSDDNVSQKEIDFAEDILKGSSSLVLHSPQIVGRLLKSFAEQPLYEDTQKIPEQVRQNVLNRYGLIMGAKQRLSQEQKDRLKSLSKAADKINIKTQEFIDEYFPNIDKPKYAIGYAIGGGIASLLASMGIALLTKSPLAPALIFGLIQKGYIYEESRKADKNPRVSKELANLAGFSEFLLEEIGLDFFLKNIGKLPKTVLSETLQETSQQLSEEIITRGSGIRKPDITEALKSIGLSGLVGGLTGFVGSAGHNVLQYTIAKKFIDNLLKRIKDDDKVYKAVKDILDKANDSQPDADTLNKVNEVIDPNKAEDYITKELRRQEEEKQAEQGQINELPDIEEAPEVKTIDLNVAHSVKSIPKNEIQVDSNRFQFKNNTNKQGVVEGQELEGKYDEYSAGTLIVWQDKEGNKYIVNGHHRLDLAKRDKNVKNVNAFVLKESDGITETDAMVIGAKTNIKEGQGSVEDYADFFRNTAITEQDAKQEGLLAKVKGQRGFTIGKNSSKFLWSIFKNNALSEDKIYNIAKYAGDNEGLQVLGIKYAQKNPKASGGEIGQVINSHKVNLGQEEAGRQAGLFDDLEYDDTELKRSEAIGKQANIIISNLKEKIKAVKGALKYPEAARKMGIIIRNEEDIRKNVNKIQQEIAEWENWHTNKEKIKELQAIVDNNEYYSENLFVNSEVKKEEDNKDTVEETSEIISQGIEPAIHLEKNNDDLFANNKKTDVKELDDNPKIKEEVVKDKIIEHIQTGEPVLNEEDKSTLEDIASNNKRTKLEQTLLDISSQIKFDKPFDDLTLPEKLEVLKTMKEPVGSENVSISDILNEFTEKYSYLKEYTDKIYLRSIAEIGEEQVGDTILFIAQNIIANAEKKLIKQSISRFTVKKSFSDLRAVKKIADKNNVRGQQHEQADFIGVFNDKNKVLYLIYKTKSNVVFGIRADIANKVEFLVKSSKMYVDAQHSDYAFIFDGNNKLAVMFKTKTYVNFVSKNVDVNEKARNIVTHFSAFHTVDNDNAILNYKTDKEIDDIISQPDDKEKDINVIQDRSTESETSKTVSSNKTGTNTKENEGTVRGSTDTTRPRNVLPETDDSQQGIREKVKRGGDVTNEDKNKAENTLNKRKEEAETNLHITDKDTKKKPNLNKDVKLTIGMGDLIPATQKDRIYSNQLCLEILAKPIEQITEKERLFLLTYTGLGGLKTGEGKNVLSAFYTPYEAIEFVWNIVQKISPSSLNKNSDCLEASEGIGRFLGFNKGVNITGVEIDEISHKIASLLFPEQTHHISSFEDFHTDKKFDLTIGNDPFGKYKPILKTKEDIAKYGHMSIHEFFLAKRLELLKSDGICCVITSTSIMDKKDSSFRKMINEKAEFITAFRLSNDVFKKTGFTGTADVLVFRKRGQNEQVTLQSEFVNTGKYAGVVVSSFYVDNNENFLGDVEIRQNKYGKNEIYIKSNKGKSYPQALYNLTKIEKKNEIPDSALPDKQETQNIIKTATSPNELPDGAFFVKDNELRQKQGDKVVFVEKLGQKKKERIETALQVMELVGKLIDTDGKINKPIQRQIRKLLIDYYDKNTAVNKGVKEHISLPYQQRDFVKLRNDPRFAELYGLIDRDGQLSGVLNPDIKYAFNKSKHIKEPDTTNINDIVDYVKQVYGSFEYTKIYDLYSGDKTTLNDELLKLYPDLNKEIVARVYYDKSSGKTIETTQTILVSDEDYLYGDIHKKIKEAEKNGYTEQVKKLKKVLPPQIKTIDEITITPLNSIVDLDTKQKFIETISDGYLTLEQSDDELKIRIKNFNKDIESISPISASELVQRTLKDQLYFYFNNKELQKRVTRIVEKGAYSRESTRKVPYPEATEQLKSLLISEFKSFVKNNKDIHNVLIDRYNKRFRSTRSQQYTDKIYTIKGLSNYFKNRKLKLRKHQLEAISRLVDTNRGILVHDVGAGKTMTAIVASMLKQQLGKESRPIFVVPSNVIGKWAFEMKQLFPSAKIFYSETNSPTARKQLFYSIKNNDFDFVVLSQEQFEAIPIREEAVELQEIIDELTVSMKKEGKTDYQIQIKIQNELAKYYELLNNNGLTKEDTIFFDDLNIGALYVDEAHSYKNLAVDYGNIKDRNIVGSNASSKRAFDMWLKVNHLHNNNNHNITFLTATLTPNKPIEIYTMLRYIDPKIWTDIGIYNAGDFVNTFANVQSKKIIKPDGSISSKSIITNYINLKALHSIYSRYIDYKMFENLDLERPDQNLEIVKTDFNLTQQMIMAQILAELENIKTDSEYAKKTGLSNAVLLTMARQLSISAEIYDAEKYRGDKNANGKIANLVKRVISHYKEGQGQIIFLDLYNGKRQPTAEERLKEIEYNRMKRMGDQDLKWYSIIPRPVLVNYHLKIKELLVEQGIPENEICIINGEFNNTPALKKQRSAEFNKGKFKIVIGSTKSMGEGMDLQANTGAVHNVDVPWTPDALKQRIGRAVRQGNQQKKVTIYNYVAKGSSDSFMYSKLAVKKQWNEDLWSGKVDNVSALNDDLSSGFLDDLAKENSLPAELVKYFTLKGQLTFIKEDIELVDTQKLKKTNQIDKLREDNIDRERKIDEIRRSGKYEYRLTLHEKSIAENKEKIEDLQIEIKEIEEKKELLVAKLTATQTMLNDIEEQYQDELNLLNNGNSNSVDEIAREINEDTKDDDNLLHFHAGIGVIGFNGNEGETHKVVYPEDIEIEQLTKEVTELNEEKRKKSSLFEDERIEEEYKKSNGLQTQQSLLAKIKDFLVEITHIATRQFRHLPNIAKYARIKNILNNQLRAKEIATDKTIRIISSITHKFDKESLDIFSRKVLLDDLYEEYKEGRPIPFYTMVIDGESYTDIEALNNDRKRIDEIINVNPHLQEAIRKRNKIWKAIAHDLVAFGLLDPSQIKKNYFRHQVLEYANTKGTLKGTQKLKRPRSGYMKKRTGTVNSINTNYLEAEFEVMAQALKDVNTAKNIKKIEDSEYNKIDEAKQKAKKYIKEQVEKYYEKLAEKIKRKLDEQIAKEKKKNEHKKTKEKTKSQIITSLKYKDYSRKLVIGFSGLGKLAYEGNLPDNEYHHFSRTIAKLGQNYERLQKKKKNKTNIDIGDDGNSNLLTPALFRYLGFLAEFYGDDQSGIYAKTIFKGIQEKETKIKEILGDNYKTWRDFIPEGYVIWQPEQGNVFYSTFTIPERLVLKILDNQDIPNLSENDLIKALAVGGKKKELVLPEEIANTLDSLFEVKTPNWVLKTATYLTGKIKQLLLFHPRKTVKYNINNGFSDLESVLLIQPKILKLLPQASKELLDVFYKKSEMSKDLRDFYERGGFSSGLTVQEIPDINILKMFSQMTEQKDYNLIRKYWKSISKFTIFREAILRYSAYLYYLDVFKQGKVELGASNAFDVLNLDTPEDQASFVANDVLGDYMKITELGKSLRDTIFPFYSWFEVNHKRLYRLIRNTIKDNAMPYSHKLGKIGVISAVTTGKVAVKTGWFMAKMLILSQIPLILATIWNYIKFPDEEDELLDYQKNKFHIILGRRSDGSVLYLSAQGAINDILETVGVDKTLPLINEYLNGKASLVDIIGLIPFISGDVGAKATLIKLVRMINPLYKMPFELLTGQTLPVWDGNTYTIVDKRRHFYKLLSMENEYDYVTKQPTRGYMRSLEDVFVSTSYINENSYRYIQNEKYKFLEKQGISSQGIYYTPKAILYRNYKKAVRFKDEEAKKRIVAKLKQIGAYNKKNLGRSLKNAHPLTGLNKQMKREFIYKYLTEKDRQKLKEALKWYENTYLKSIRQ